MTLTVLYFGELREQINLSHESLELSDQALTVEKLLAHLIARGAPWSVALGSEEPLRIAINQEMAQRSTTVPPQAEVAFFRPVTGG